MSSKENVSVEWKCMGVRGHARGLRARCGRCACAAPAGVCAVARRVLPAACAGAGRETALAQRCSTHTHYRCGWFHSSTPTYKNHLDPIYFYKYPYL